jgi:ankyrin repeat protein
MWASNKNHVGLVRWLLDQGAAMDERSNGGSTALWFASYHSHLHVVRLVVMMMMLLVTMRC